MAHVVYDIPLFNRQRLLNRNLLEVDLALAVIFAAWIDRMFTPVIDAPTPVDVSSVDPSSPVDVSSAPVVMAETSGAPRGTLRRRAPRWTSDVVLPLIPPAAVVMLQLVLLIGGPWFPHILHVPGVVTRHNLWPLVAALSVPSAVAVTAGWIVVRRSHLRRRLPAVLIALVVVDLAVFNVGTQSTPDPHDAGSASSAQANRLAAMVVAEGQGPAGGLHRVGMFDPDLFYPVPADRIGQPDLTLLRSLDSVQGYGAVVDEHYDAQTGTHLQLDLTPSALSGGTFAQLDLGLLVTAPEYFVHLVDRPPGFTGSLGNGAVALPPVAPDPAAPPDRSTPAPTPPGDFAFASASAPTATLAPGTTRTQYFGTVLAVTAVTVPLPAGGAGGLRIGLLSPDGRTTSWLGPSQSVAGRIQVTAGVDHAPVAASGIVLLATPAARVPTRVAASAVTVGDALVRTAGQGTYRVDGSLRDIVTPPQWRYVGSDGVFSVFAQPGARGRAWVIGGASATARVLSDSPWGDETIRVNTPRPATLVRSVQFAAGWQATVTGTGPEGRATGTSRAVVIRRSGLLQAVSVPGGVHLVRFTYRPSRAYEGLGVSALGVLALLVLAGGPAVRRRRRRRRRRSIRSEPVDPHHYS